MLTLEEAAPTSLGDVRARACAESRRGVGVAFTARMPLVARAQISRTMLHGDNRNRWYDKCFNIIVCANGKSGIAWEHAWGDGVAILRMFNDVSMRVAAAGCRSSCCCCCDSATRQCEYVRNCVARLRDGLCVVSGAVFYNDSVGRVIMTPCVRCRCTGS